MQEQLYRQIVEGNTNFDFYMRSIEDAGRDMRGAIAQYDADGHPVGFFIPVAPFWGAMYDTGTLYQRGAQGGTSDQFAGSAIQNGLFVPVDTSSYCNVALHLSTTVDTDDVDSVYCGCCGRC